MDSRKGATFSKALLIVERLQPFSGQALTFQCSGAQPSQPSHPLRRRITLTNQSVTPRAECGPPDAILSGVTLSHSYYNSNDDLRLIENEEDKHELQSYQNDRNFIRSCYGVLSRRRQLKRFRAGLARARS